MDVQGIIEKLKELVKKGNVSRIVVKRRGESILNVPVNVGVAGAAVGLAAAKWALIAAVIATIGFGCTVEIVRQDGNTVSVMNEENSKKVREFAGDTVEKVKEIFPVSINMDVRRDNDTAAAPAEIRTETDEEPLEPVEIKRED